MRHNIQNKSRIDKRRRRILEAGAAGLAVTALPVMRTAFAAEPIKIGILLPKSGPYAVTGERGHNGATVAVADVKGEVLGRPVQLVWLDENGPQATQQNMLRLIQQEKVVAVSGCISSGDTLAIMPVAEREKTLLIATGPNASEITGSKCNRYTFRVDLPNYETTRSVYPHLKKYGKSWYFLYASYAFGIDGYQQMSGLLKQDGGKVVGADTTPLGTTDFSSFILKIAAAKPDLVFLTIGGSDMVNFLKQYHQMGLTGKIPISNVVCDDSDLWSAGPEAATGIWPKIWNHTGSQNTERSKNFITSYQTRFKSVPGNQSWQDWFSVTSILTAIRETGTTDSGKLVQFLESHKFEGYKKDPMYYRSWDHELVQPTLITKVKDKITDKYDLLDVIAEVPAKGQTYDELFGVEKDSACKMPKSL